MWCRPRGADGENTMRDRDQRSGRRLRRVAVTATGALVLMAVAGVSYGVLGRDVRFSALLPTPAPTVAGTSSTSPRPAAPTPDVETPEATPASPTQTAEPEPSPEPAPEPVLEPGDEGLQVRELQARLAQLAWFAPVTTGSYGPDTRTAVAGFQDKRGFEATGTVDDAHLAPARPDEPRPDRGRAAQRARPDPARRGGPGPRRARARGPAAADRLVLRRRRRHLRRPDPRGRLRVPGQARHPRHRRGRPAHPRPARRHDQRADRRRARQPQARPGRRRPARPALHHRHGAVHRQDVRQPALGRRRRRRR